MRGLPALLGLALWTQAGLADQTRYTLAPDPGTVRFSYTLNGATTQGEMPVQSAEILVDFDRLSGSSARVALDASRARAGLIFATEAMRGPQVLDTARHPLIRFESSAIRGDYSTARMEGQLTIRGVTRPVTLTGGLYQQRGQDPGDLEQLVILMRGRVDRTDFGASGFPEFVGPMIDITVLARIVRAD